MAHRFPSIDLSFALIAAFRKGACAVVSWGAAASILFPFAATAAELSAEQAAAAGCPAPVLSRLTEHSVAAGETLEAIAQTYMLLPSTLIGLNPDLANQAPTPGTTLQIPPYNGIVTRPASGMTWQDLGDRYGVRADVLFEINGCQEVSDVVFVPGVNWFPGVGQVTQVPQLAAYPLPDTATVLLGYGWQVNAAQDDVEFHSGVDLEATTGTPVLAVDAGVVAFAGEQGSYGKLVVINHSDGLQSRYAQLETIQVSVGQQVGHGDPIATSGQTGDQADPQTGAALPHLHFEIRENSAMGWVAQDPSRYIESLRMFSR